VHRKVVVTGAAGFIGGHLCRSLVADRASRIIGIDSLRSGDWSRTPTEVERVECDIVELRQQEWAALMDGADVVFHLAAEKYNSSKSTPDKLLNANVLATERLCRAAAQARVGRVVFTSSLYAYGSMGPGKMSEDDVPVPSTLYGSSKLMGENILRSVDREIGLSWNVARLFFVYGSHQHAEGGYKSVIMTNFERLVAGEPPLIIGDGLQSLDYVYVDDCVSALRELGVSQTDRHVVNVASGHPTSIVELTNLMLEVSGSTAHAVFGPPDWTAGSSRAGEPSHMREVFGWEAKTSLAEGLHKVFEWMTGNRQ
jgi:UDP-glucose 4-epimerase